jgi:hypothetical protein
MRDADRTCKLRGTIWPIETSKLRAHAKSAFAGDPQRRQSAGRFDRPKHYI